MTAKVFIILMLLIQNGYHWTAEMDNKQEKWLVYSKVWQKDPQQPLDL
jgi:hypothetical protein